MNGATLPLFTIVLVDAADNNWKVYILLVLRQRFHSFIVWRMLGARAMSVRHVYMSVMCNWIVRTFCMACSPYRTAVRVPESNRTEQMWRTFRRIALAIDLCKDMQHISALAGAPAFSRYCCHGPLPSSNHSSRRKKHRPHSFALASIRFFCCFATHMSACCHCYVGCCGW